MVGAFGLVTLRGLRVPSCATALVGVACARRGRGTIARMGAPVHGRAGVRCAADAGSPLVVLVLVLVLVLVGITRPSDSEGPAQMGWVGTPSKGGTRVRLAQASTAPNGCLSGVGASGVSRSEGAMGAVVSMGMRTALKRTE